MPAVCSSTVRAAGPGWHPWFNWELSHAALTSHLVLHHSGLCPCHASPCCCALLLCWSVQVLAPYDSEDARGLLKAAIRDPDPIIFLENELMYGVAFPVDEKVRGRDQAQAAEGARPPTLAMLALRPVPARSG